MTITRTLTAVSFVAALALSSVPAAAQEAPPPPAPRLHWSFGGPLGVYNPEQLQRGFKIYKEVCSNCHSMDYLSFRNLADPGGPGFNEEQVKALAATYKINDIDDKGQPIERPGRPADYFPSPFPNAAAAAATYGVAPPDMSTLAKARTTSRGFPWFILDFFLPYQEQGPDYIAAILRGYENPPPGVKLPPNGHYNKYFPGHNIAMPPPLQDGQVKYDDGAPETLQQYSQDIAAFLMWVAEPKLDQRHRLGFQVMIFLLVLSGLLYFTKRKVWHEVEAPREIAQGQDPAKTSI